MHIDTLVNDIPTTKEVHKVDLREVAKRINESPSGLTLREHEMTEEEKAIQAKFIEQAEDEHILDKLEENAKKR